MNHDIQVIFVCWGNICRSPMAERIAEAVAAREGLSGVYFTSAGVSSEESGHPIDPRARRVLAAHGYDGEHHRAHRITADEIAGADLVIGLEQLHVDRMRQVLPDATNLALLTDFDPAAEPGSGIDDPWYGNEAGFEKTLAAVEAAVPGVLRQVKTLQHR
ncbi:MAG: low molecular weight protein-tyrosine-phosphatase [Propioniciclava sp.]